MKTAILNYIKTSAARHVFFIALGVGGFVVGRSWLSEHDARLTSEAVIKQAQSTIASLQTQQASNTQAAKVQVVQLQAAAEAVKTAPQAVAALPTVESDLHAETLGDVTPVEAPQKVAVDAVPLYQELNECRQNAVNRNACQLNLDLEKRIGVEKDTEIKALKSNGGFWHRAKEAAITVGIGVAIGYAAHK